MEGPERLLTTGVTGLRGGGWAEKLFTTGATSLEEPEKLLTTRATGLGGGGREVDNNRSNSIGVAREAVNNTINRAGGGGADRLIITGATVLEEPEKLLTTGAT